MNEMWIYRLFNKCFQLSNWNFCAAAFGAPVAPAVPMED